MHSGKSLIETLLAGRHRPSAGMCMACKFREANCSRLPFDTMPVMRKDKDGTPVVRCTEFVHASQEPKP